jgi:hypothetical protein
LQPTWWQTDFCGHHWHCRRLQRRHYISPKAHCAVWCASGHTSNSVAACRSPRFRAIACYCSPGRAGAVKASAPVASRPILIFRNVVGLPVFYADFRASLQRLTGYRDDNHSPCRKREADYQHIENPVALIRRLARMHAPDFHGRSSKPALARNTTLMFRVAIAHAPLPCWIRARSRPLYSFCRTLKHGSHAVVRLWRQSPPGTVRLAPGSLDPQCLRAILIGCFPNGMAICLIVFGALLPTYQ